MQRSSVTGKDHLYPSAIDDVGWTDALILYEDAPWFQKDSVFDTDLIRKYVEGDYWNQINISLDVT